MNTKQLLRQIVSKKIKAMPQEEKDKQDAHICQQLIEICRDATCVYAYIPLVDEVNILAFLEYLSRQHIPIYCTIQKNGVHNWHECRVKKIPSNGTWQVHMCSDATFTHHPSHIIVPGRAFTIDGHRLGRGHGFYDRFLSSAHINAVRTIGVCYAPQIVDAIPVELHDEMVQTVIHA